MSSGRSFGSVKKESFNKFMKGFEVEDFVKDLDVNRNMKKAKNVKGILIEEN